MFGLSKIDTHMNLVMRMGDTVGADIEDALVSGRLSPENLRGAVLRCTSCRDVGACEDWLEERAEMGSDSPPAYCRNHAIFEALKG